MNDMTQAQMVLEHLEKHGGITPQQALYRYGIMRLGARIWDLKRAGHRIDMEWVEGQNRYVQRTRFARYVLSDENA